MFIVHGPAGSTTGLGYTTEYFVEGINKIGVTAVAAADSNEWWRTDGYHLVINQPMLLQESTPWHGFVPFFEFTPRPDEIPNLQLNWPKRSLFASNPWMKEELIGLQKNDELKKRVFDFQLGANIERVSPKPRIPGSIVTVGKAEPRKGTGILLDALDTCGRAATLAITHPLHSETDQLGITQRLQNTSVEHTLVPFFQSHDEVRALFDVSHVAVFPACAEGWNMGLTEALAAGCIVVASDIPAHRYQYEILCKYLNTEQIERCLILVPTSEVNMEFHPRWYPMAHYAGQKWLAPHSDGVAKAIEHAITLPEPPAFDPETFPLSWERSAYRFIERVLEDRCKRRPDDSPETIGATLGIPEDPAAEISEGLKKP